MRRRTLESVQLHSEHRGSGRRGMKGGRVGPLDRWLSDGSLDTLGRLIWWSLIVCPGLFMRLSLRSSTGSSARAASAC